MFIFFLYPIFTNALVYYRYDDLSQLRPNQHYVIKQNYDLKGSTVTIPEGCVLELYGSSLNNGYLILSDNIIINNGNFHDVIISSSSNNIKFKNCVFEGGVINNSGTSYGKGLMSFEGSSNVTIINCRFHDGRLGLYCFKVNNVRVTNTVFERLSYWPNYFSSVKGLLFDGCYSSHNGEDGIKLTGEIGDVTISNNESCYNGQDGFDFAGHSCYNVSIINNNFHNNKLNGITFKTLDKNLYPLKRWGLVDTALKWLDINISNNYIYNNKYTSISSYNYYAEKMDKRFGNFIISNNFIFSDIGSITGIHVSANTNVYHGVIISNNDIIGNFIYGSTLSNARYYLFKYNNIWVNGTGLRIDKQNYNGEPVNNDILHNIISAYYGSALHLYPETVNINVRYNNLKSTKCYAIKNLGFNNIAYFENLIFRNDWWNGKSE